MGDLSDDAIRKALLKIQNQREQTNWMAITYAEGTSDKFVLYKVGSGEMIEVFRYLGSKFIGFIYLRVDMLLGKKCSPKFIMGMYFGSESTSFQKARLYLHKEDVIAVLKPINAEMIIFEESDLLDTNIAKILSNYENN